MTLLEALRDAVTLADRYVRTHYVCRVAEGYAVLAYNDDGLPVAFSADPDANLHRYGMYFSRRAWLGNWGRLIAK